MERLNIDTIGPLPEDNRGNKYILVILDGFTRFVRLTPTIDATANSAAIALLSFVCEYGFPRQIITDGAGDMTNYGALFTGFQSINSRQGSSSYIDTNGNLVLDWAQTGFIPASSYDNLIINSGSPIWQGLENLDNIIVDSDNIVLNDSTALYLSLSSSFTNFNSIGIFVLNDPFGAVSNSENVVILGTQSQIPVNSVGLNNVLLAPGISATFSNVTLTTGGSFAGPLNGNATTSSGLLTVTNTWAGYLTRVSANTNFPTFFQVWSTNPSAGALLPMGEYVRSNSAAGGYIYNRGGQSTWNTVP